MSNVSGIASSSDGTVDFGYNKTVCSMAIEIKVVIGKDSTKRVSQTKIS